MQAADSYESHRDARQIGCFNDFSLAYGDQLVKEFSRFTHATFNADVSSSSLPLAQQHPFDVMFDCIWSWPPSELQKLRSRMQLTGLNKWSELSQLMQTSLVKHQDCLSRAASIMMSAENANEISTIRKELVPSTSSSLSRSHVNHQHSKRPRSDSHETDQPPSQSRRVYTDTADINGIFASKSTTPTNHQSIPVVKQEVDLTNDSDPVVFDSPTCSIPTSRSRSIKMDIGHSDHDMSNDNPEYIQHELDNQSAEADFEAEGASLFHQVPSTEAPVISDVDQEQEEKNDVVVEAAPCVPWASLNHDAFFHICSFFSLDEQNTKLGRLGRYELQMMEKWRSLKQMWGSTLDLKISRGTDNDLRMQRLRKAVLSQANISTVPSTLLSIEHTSNITMRWLFSEDTSDTDKKVMIDLVLAKLTTTDLNKLVIHETVVKNKPSFIAAFLEHLTTGANGSRVNSLMSLQLSLSGSKLSALNGLSWEGLSALKDLARFSLLEKFQSGTQAYLEKVIEHLPSTITDLALDRDFDDYPENISTFDASAIQCWRQKLASVESLPNLRKISGSIQLHTDPKAMCALLQGNVKSSRAIRCVYLRNSCFNADWSVNILPRFCRISELHFTLKNNDQLQTLVSLEPTVLPKLQACIISLHSVNQNMVLPLMTFLARNNLIRLDLATTRSVNEIQLNDQAAAKLATLDQLVELRLNGFEICWDFTHLTGCWPCLQELDASSCTFKSSGSSGKSELESVESQRAQVEQILSVSQDVTSILPQDRCSHLRVFKSSELDPAAVISALYRCCPFIKQIEIKTPLRSCDVNLSLKRTYLEQAWQPHPDNLSGDLGFGHLFSLQIAEFDDDAVHFLIGKLVNAPRLAYFIAPGNIRAMSLRSRLKHLQGLAPSELKQLEQPVQDIYSSCVRSGFTVDVDGTLPNWSEPMLTGDINGWGKKYHRFKTSEDGCNGQEKFFTTIFERLSQADRNAVEAWNHGDYNVDVRLKRVKRQAVSYGRV